MSKTVSELIGQIINPVPVPVAPQAERNAVGSESVEALIERIIYPHGRPVAKWASRPVDPRGSTPVPTLEPVAAR